MEVKMSEFCTDFVFENFNDQARQMQYAVLFLFTQRDLQDLRKFSCRPDLGRLTNYKSAFFPYYNYVNYVVANYNEQRDFHAEETLCNRFEDVLTGFGHANNVSQPEAMLLYTYYFPCQDCANNILSKLGIGADLYLGYSEYSMRWTNKPLVTAMFENTFVHMFRVHNTSHVPPEDSSSSESSSSEQEEDSSSSESSSSEQEEDEDENDQDYHWW